MPMDCADCGWSNGDHHPDCPAFVVPNYDYEDADWEHPGDEPFERDPSASAVSGHWIILRRPNCAPEVKVPQNDHQGVTAMLRELHRLYPEAQTTVVRLAYGGDMWADDGREWLMIADAAAVDAAEDPAPAPPE